MSESPDATNPVAADDEPVMAAEGVADEAQAHGDEQDQDEQGAGDGQPEEDLEDLELEGAKYRVPKAIKEAAMRQADYTRKTQEVAATRQELEQRAQAVAQQAEAVASLREDYGQVHALDMQVKAFAALDWSALTAEDPANAQALWMQYQQVKDAHQGAQAALQTKEAARLDEQRATRARQFEETGRVLARDIKGWSADTARQIVDFATKEIGVEEHELRDTADPRMWKLLHRAYTAEQALKKQEAGKRIAAATTVQPAKVIGAKAAPQPAGLHDNLTADEWRRRRDAQVQRRA